jgi:hypothetical protein
MAVLAADSQGGASHGFRDSMDESRRRADEHVELNWAGGAESSRQILRQFQPGGAEAVHLPVSGYQLAALGHGLHLDLQLRCTRWGLFSKCGR